MASKNRSRETRKAMKLLMLWVLGFLPLTLAMTGEVSEQDELEIAKLLKKMNKPYVKSIKCPSGDIIDCVPFHLQPAFDHPLVKNVSYQNVRPRFHGEALSGSRSSGRKRVSQLWNTKGTCPEGTVAIMRTTREAILRSRSIGKFGKKFPGTSRNPSPSPNGIANPLHEHAIRRTNGVFQGTEVEVGLWNPSVEFPHEFSLAQVWVHAGAGTRNCNSVEAGWQVYPHLYNDTRTRLFGYYTKDNYRHGYYNYEAPFVQESRSMTLGGIIGPVSAIDGVQHEMNLFLFKDPLTGNWRLEVNEESVGYWPATLFTLLRDGPATGVDWGGEIINSNPGGRHTATQMGSGRFSTVAAPNAAAFTNIKVLNRAFSLTDPASVRTIVTNEHCYDLTVRADGDGFTFGGPGRGMFCNIL